MANYPTSVSRLPVLMIFLVEFVFCLSATVDMLPLIVLNLWYAFCGVSTRSGVCDHEARTALEEQSVQLVSWLFLIDPLY
jgi:hypothetical protein